MNITIVGLDPHPPVFGPFSPVQHHVGCKDKKSSKRWEFSRPSYPHKRCQQSGVDLPEAKGLKWRSCSFAPRKARKSSSKRESAAKGQAIGMSTARFILDSTLFEHLFHPEPFDPTARFPAFSTAILSGVMPKRPLQMASCCFFHITWSCVYQLSN